MDHIRNHTSNDKLSPEQDADPLDIVSDLIGTIGAEIEALKQEREADHVRSARLRLGAAYAKARQQKRDHGR